MKNITFKRLKISNFLSIGNTPVEVKFKPGVNFITGTNLDVPGTNNGSGKSSVIDAFNFAIFGDTLRPLIKNQIVNNISTGDTIVELELICASPKGTNTFIIKRTLNPSTCKVFKDGRDKTLDSIPNTNKYILEVLSASQDIFKHCIIMRANNNLPFMAQGKIEKKKFIESLFNLDTITKMSKLVKDDINLKKRDIDIESKLFHQLKSNIDTYENKINELTEEVEHFSNKLKNDINNIDKEIDEITHKNNTLSDQLSEMLTKKSDEKEINAEHEAKLDKTESFKRAVSKKILLIKSEINNIKIKIKELDNHACPTCKRLFDSSDADKISDLLQKYKEELQASEKQLNDYNNKEKSLNQIISETSAKISKYKSIDNTIKFIEDNINNNKNLLSAKQQNKNILLEQQKPSNSAINSVIEMKNDAMIDLNKKETLVKELNTSFELLEVARFILSEEGIRSYIIKKLLDLLNFRIKYYLSKQNSQYTLQFDEMFADTIVNRRNLPVSYYNLSGAESKMLDLACIWAFRDIIRLQGSVNFSISFYDELLDSSMDAHNTEIVYNILNEFGKETNQCIYIVSHKPDSNKAITGEIITLEKQNGITRRVS